MIEHIKNHWKVIVICVLAAIIVYLLYQRGKGLIEKPQDKMGKIDKMVEKEEVVEDKSPVNFDQIFEDYQSGKISQKEAQAKSGLATGTFYRKLKKYDNRKTDAV